MLRGGALARCQMKHASQPVQLCLVEELRGRCGGFRGTVERRERSVELAGGCMGLRGETEPHGVVKSGAGPMPAGKAGLKLRDPFLMLAEAGKRGAPADRTNSEPPSKAMLARDRNRRFGLPSRCLELPSPLMNDRRKT